MNELRNKPISAKKNIPDNRDRWIQLSTKRFSVISVTCHALPWTIVVDRITVEQFWCRVAAQIWISSHLTVWRRVHNSGNASMPPLKAAKRYSKKIDDMCDTQLRFSLAYKYNHNWHIHNKPIVFYPTRPVDHWPKKPSNINQETTFDQHTHPQNILDQSCKKHDPKVKEPLDPSFLQARKKKSANNNHKQQQLPLQIVPGECCSLDIPESWHPCGMFGPSSLRE